ncbi:hypothetical protein [Fastidiosibacter lacustris]|uniref:hypothetical protein n=1 Tax=Fastidiosibacter lacustris TaxID=2056695 RepID=UPI003B831A12
MEAGVDVDFPYVMRAEAGLDSIAQAAGRCNRERKRAKEDSHVWIFKSPDWQVPPELKSLAAGMRSTLRQNFDNLLGQEAIKTYFSEVYWRKGAELDQKQLLKDCSNHAKKLSFPFQNIARDFLMIESCMQPVFIQFDNEAEHLLKELEVTDDVSRILRKLQPYIVQIPKQGFDSLVATNAVQTVAPYRFQEQFWVLINRDIYDDECGISWDNPTFMKAESSIF